MSKDLLRNGDVLSAAVLAALGAYVFMEARNWTYYGEDGPGPGFFPVWYGVAMVALSLLLMGTAIVKRQPPEHFDWPAIRRAMAVWLVFAICAALMGWLGFLVSFSMLTFFVVTVVFAQPAWKAVVIAIGAAAVFYVVFPLSLSVALPVGIFGF